MAAQRSKKRWTRFGIPMVAQRTKKRRMRFGVTLKIRRQRLAKNICAIWSVSFAQAKDRKSPDPELQAQAIRRKLVRRIDHDRSSQARWLHYGYFVDENSDLRFCHLIRLTNNQLKISQRRGSRSRTAAREEAAAIKNISQLDVVERRAFDILKGARRKPRKNPIEKRAIQLADATKEKLFAPRRAGRPKGKRTRKSDAEAQSFEALKPRLTLTDLVSIAAPTATHCDRQERVVPRRSLGPMVGR